MEESADAAAAVAMACSSAQRRDSVGIGCATSVTPAAYLRRHGVQFQVILLITTLCGVWIRSLVIYLRVSLEVEISISMALTHQNQI